MLTSFIIAGVAGYLLGSIPFGYLVARSNGVNIFEVGSKSPGATNVRRVLGNGPGYLVLALDALKGAVATGWPLALAKLAAAEHGAGAFYIEVNPLPYMVVGLLGALLGHAFSCFTGFRGGKSVATGAGGILVLFPLGALVAALVFALSLAVARYVSLASMLAGVALTVAACLVPNPTLLRGICIFITLFVIVRHRANISRLIAGTESKIGVAKPEANKP